MSNFSKIGSFSIEEPLKLKSKAEYNVKIYKPNSNPTCIFTQDTDAEGPETFFVNLTSVELVSGQPVSGAEPSIKNGQNVAEITIWQNDNANGILELDATKV